MHWVFFEMNVVMALRELIFNLKKASGEKLMIFSLYL